MGGADAGAGAGGQLLVLRWPEDSGKHNMLGGFDRLSCLGLVLLSCLILLIRSMILNATRLVDEFMVYGTV